MHEKQRKEEMKEGINREKCKEGNRKNENKM
jgi:hypothetical protein